MVTRQGVGTSEQGTNRTYSSRRASTKSSTVEPKRADWLPSAEPRTGTTDRCSN